MNLYRIFADKITRVVLESQPEKAFFKTKYACRKLSPELLKNMKGILQRRCYFLLQQTGSG